MNKLGEKQKVKEIDVHTLKHLFDNKEAFQLIDVREPYERDVANIGGKLIPLGKIYFHLAEIAKDKQVIIYCRSGRRSADAVRLLQAVTGNSKMYNLTGGILAWAAEIDKTLTFDL